MDGDRFLERYRRVVQRWSPTNINLLIICFFFFLQNEYVTSRLNGYSTSMNVIH
jgi:hypothetical protein